MLISGLEFELPLHAFLSHDTIHPVYGTPSYLNFPHMLSNVCNAQ
jgi:hypothetical protein